MRYVFRPDRFQRARMARERYGLYFVRSMSVLMLIGQLVMDATRSSWKTPAAWGIFCSGWRYERRPPCLIPFIQGGPPLLSVQRWWVTLLLAALIVWWVRRVDVERRRVWSFFWVIVIAWTHVIGFVFLTDRPELFQLPMWWIALWILWPISLLVYSLTGRPRHPFFD
ncbi:MAG: hypothetical protein ACK5TE_07215 [Pseudomonadota bacterium]|jgi:hypothetical protein